MAQNQLKIEHYILNRTLGVGAFAKVKRNLYKQIFIVAKHDITNLNVAIKIINKKKMKNSKMSNKIKREIRLLRYFNHQNIVRLYEVLDTHADIFVVTEYISGGDLFDIIAQKGKLSEQDSKYYFRQIVAGVDYCHKNLVAHRDLKPENILIDVNNTIKIADFGLSNLMRDGKFLKTSCGSPNYAAPEVISGKVYCGTEIDTWSCGVILYALLAGYLPFDEEVMAQLFKKIREADYVMPSSFSAEAKDIVNRMLQPDPSNRIAFSEIRLHPWLRENVPFYIEIFNLNTKMDNQKRINEEAFQRLMQQPNIVLHGLTEDKVRKAIDKRKEYSFVIAYDLILDDQKRTMISTSNNEKKNQDSYAFKPIAEDLNCNISYIDNVYNYTDKKITQEESEFIGDWTYGKIYSLPAKQLMKHIYDTLGQLDTVISIKSADYRIKCYYNNPIRPNQFSNQKELMMVEEECNDNTLEQEQEKKGGKGEMSEKKHKASKFSMKVIFFTIQIYAMPNNKDHLIDIILNRGHPIIFIEFCNKFLNILNQKIVNIQQ